MFKDSVPKFFSLGDFYAWERFSVTRQKGATYEQTFVSNDSSEDSKLPEINSFFNLYVYFYCEIQQLPLIFNLQNVSL